MTAPDPRFLRASAFERRLAAAVGQVVEAPWGLAYLDPALDMVWDRNRLWLTGDADRRDAAALHAEAYRLLAGAGLRHRRIVAEDPLAARLAPGFAALGYREDRHVVMALAGVPDGPPAQDVSAGELAAAYVRWLRTDPVFAADPPDAELERQLAEHQRSLGSAGATERVLAVLDHGAPVAWAKCWTRDGIGQVEDVICLHPHRGRGHGRTVTAAAARAALDAGSELVFIVADADDWPRELYARLGFAPVGLRRVFTQP